MSSDILTPWLAPCRGVTQQGDNMSKLTHTYSHKPLGMIQVAICNHQANSPIHVCPGVWYGDSHACTEYSRVIMKQCADILFDRL